MRWGKIMKKAQSGIGTLIIFIAMLLVAAVAAGVLIQTTGSLQNKALVTGTQASSQISTHIDVISISGTNGSSSSSIENVSFIVRLSAGSEQIDLKDLVTTIDTPTDSQSVVFSDWTVTYLQNGTNHQNDYLVTGDVAMLKVELDTPIGETTEVTVEFIPKSGIPTTTMFITPDIISQYNVNLYP